MKNQNIKNELLKQINECDFLSESEKMELFSDMNNASYEKMIIENMRQFDMELESAIEYFIESEY